MRLRLEQFIVQGPTGGVCTVTLYTVPSGVMDMCFENDPDDFADLFSTHPSVTKRVQALVQTAGGRLPPEAPPGPPKVSERQPLPEIAQTSATHGPWSRPAPPASGG